MPRTAKHKLIPKGSDHPLQPTAALLCKLGTIVMHVSGVFDWHDVIVLVEDTEVKAWLSKMRERALVPIKQNPSHGTDADGQAVHTTTQKLQSPE